jgi:RpiB/LacA/LacB family sugar-phosphate isomerase
MRIVIGSDHAGYDLKLVIVDTVKAMGHEVIDVGTYSKEKVDFPDFAEKVGENILSGSADRGVAICGSGVGVCIAANKIPGIYAAVCHDTYTAHQGVEHDGMNVLCLGGRVVGVELAIEIIKSFLNANFIEDERFNRRVSKIKAIEMKTIKSHYE